ncbi:MAG: hypothetical protein NXI15_10165 [Gammaproteobacteria bacterium]|nr:hypothetical protein [Gammaproteobacteria bacterium]
MITSHLIVLLILLLPSTGQAYLDPGTGSMLIQGVVAAVALAAVTLKHYWYRLLRFFGRSKENPEDEAENSKQRSEEAPD